MMKKQEANYEQIQNQEKIITDIVDAYKIMDETYTPTIPNEQFFEQLIVDTKQNMKQRLYKDLFYFLLVSIAVLTFVVFSLIKSPDFFIVLQILSIVLCPAGLYLLQKKTRQDNKHAS